MILQLIFFFIKSFLDCRRFLGDQLFKNGASIFLCAFIRTYKLNESEEKAGVFNTVKLLSKRRVATFIENLVKTFNNKKRGSSTRNEKQTVKNV